MRIYSGLTDDTILRELGERLAGVRLGQNLTQASLAEQAGVSKRTVERLESGEVATQLSGFIRVCRVLGLLERLDAFLPGPTASPMELLKMQGKKRRRASGRRLAVEEPRKWTWGESS